MNNNDYKEVLFYAASIFNERMGTEFSEDNLVLRCFQTENQHESFEQFCQQYFPDRLTDRYKEDGYFDFHASAFGLVCRSGGTGRRTGLKILRDLYSRTGSIPVCGISKRWEKR